MKKKTTEIKWNQNIRNRLRWWWWEWLRLNKSNQMLIRSDIQSFNHDGKFNRTKVNHDNYLNCSWFLQHLLPLGSLKYSSRLFLSFCVNRRWNFLVKFMINTKNNVHMEKELFFFYFQNNSILCWFFFFLSRSLSITFHNVSNSRLYYMIVLKDKIVIMIRGWKWWLLSRCEC